ncbi:hypothetical protein B566_EDAN010503 [Ephemera danica]|nr:hypothetical protein B566_EDAN010503 [Ephemera danica]
MASSEAAEEREELPGANMAPSPPPTGLLHQSAGTSNVLGSLPSRLVTEDTPPDMLAGSMDLRVTLPNGQTVKMSVERRTVAGALDTWSICVVPRNQALVSQQLMASANKRAPPKPLALQPQQPFEQTFRLQVRLPRNQLFVARLSPRTPLLDILEHVCREKNLEAAKYELRHPVNTDQPLQLSLSLADYRLTEVALVPRGSRAPTELSSSDIPALQTRSEETLLVSANSRQQRGSNPASSTSTSSGGGGGGIFANMLKRTRSGGGGKEGSVSGDSLGGRSSSPARSDESAGRSVSPPAPRPLSQPQQPPLPTRHRKGRAPKPPSQATTSSVDKSNNAAANTEPAVVEAPADHILVISHSRNSSDSSGYHEASVLSERKATKASKSQQSKQFSRSMSNLSSEASTSTSQPSQKLSSVHSMSTTSLSKKKRAPAPPPPPSTISEPRQPEPSPTVFATEPAAVPPVSSIVLEPARPNPTPRTLIQNTPSPPSRLTQQERQPKSSSQQPPPIAPRHTKPSNGKELFKKSNSASRSFLEAAKKAEKSRDMNARRRSSLHSSIGSSSSSVFGIGKSLLAMGSSQDLAPDSDDDLDLAMFEGGKDNTDGEHAEDTEALEKFQSLLQSKRRNSITQILNKSSRKKAPAPKAPKPVGYRVRPRLEQVSWSTVDDGNDVTSNFILAKNDPSRDTETQYWSQSKEENVDNSSLSGDGTSSEAESMKEPESLAESCSKDDDDDSAGEDDLDSAFQSVTDVLEEQLRAEEATALRKLAEDKAAEDETERQRSSPEVSVEDAEDLARSEKQADAKRHEEWLRAEEERRKAEDERRRFEEERARLAKEREELARQKREQQALELELRERLQRELEVKQRAMQLEQRREIERLQKEQEELEQELKEKELEKLQRLKSKPALEIQLTEQEITDIPDWEYKLPAPPSAFRDKQVELTDMKQNEENEERRSPLWSTNSEEVATKNKINMMLETAKDSADEEMETRPKPPEVVELRVKPTVLCEPEPRSLSPPRITVQPLRSAHSLYSLVQADEDSLKLTQGEKVGQNLRKTSSVADVSAMGVLWNQEIAPQRLCPLRSSEKSERGRWMLLLASPLAGCLTAAAPASDVGDDEEQRLQQLQQQCIQWQEQLLTNQSVLQGHVSMPLQSLQVLREILPQMKQKLSEDASEKNDAVTLRSSTLPRTPRPVSASIVSLESSSSTTLDRRTTPAPVSQQRYRPPTVNLGTWSERPKSEVSIKQDSDYRIGFGQYQHTAARAPVVRSAEPKLKDTTNLIAGGAINRELVTRSNSWRVTPSTPLHKPSMVVIQNTSTTTTEQVRASNKPTVILRHQPRSLSDLPTQQRRYTTLVGINGAPQPSQQLSSNQQRINITQASNPVVKGFKIETRNPIPTPPPPVIRNVTQKRVNKIYAAVERRKKLVKH